MRRDKPIVLANENETKVQNNAFDVWIDGDEIRAEIRQLARLYRRCTDLTICPILNGGLTFASLSGRMSDQLHSPPIKIVPVIASSYKNGQNAGKLKVYSQWIKDTKGADIRGRTILVLDDVLETGATAKAVVKLLKAYEPREIKTAFIVGKDIPERKFHGDYVLFPVPAVNPVTSERLFFVGSGMDWAGDYRFIEDIIDVNSRPDLKRLALQSGLT